MAIHWTLTLKCDDCGATIRYEDERPEWQTDEERANQNRAARMFVEQNPIVQARYGNTGSPTAAMAPPPGVTLVRQVLSDWESRLTELPDRYVNCPACPGRAYKGSGETEEAATVPTEESAAVG